jgi:glycosyltransferase involved in cell wall biosynthesis
MVRDGETGLLVSPGDVEALRTSIERLLERPAWRAQLGSAGRKVVESNYDAHLNSARLMDVLKAATDRAHRLPRESQVRQLAETPT